LQQAFGRSGRPISWHLNDNESLVAPAIGFSPGYRAFLLTNAAGGRGKSRYCPEQLFWMDRMFHLSGYSGIRLPGVPHPPLV